MAAAAEICIYQESPEAPTPQELREGICLLLDTFGHPEYHYSVDPQNREPYTFTHLSGKIKTSDGNIGKLTFQSSIDHNGPGCVGLNVEIDDKIYGEEIHEDPFTKELIAVSHVPSESERMLDPDQRKQTGKLILATWLRLQD